MVRPVVLIAVLLFAALPRAASACTCVVDPDRPFTVQPESKSVFAIGTVKQIRTLESNPRFYAVVVEITEPILNAKAGDVITFFTRVQGGTCGYPRFVSGASYVVESYYYIPGPPSLDPIERTVLDEMWGEVPAGSQIVSMCGKTQPMDTPEGDKALGEIREAVRRLKK